MRPLQITISVFSKKTAEIVGEEVRSFDVQRQCVIDLDRVESFWEDLACEGGDGLLIKLYSGDSFWTKQYTLEQFVKIIEKYQAQHFGNIGICAGKPEPCVVCGQSDQIVQHGHEFECVACGFKWVTSNAPRGLSGD
jgi:predicted RNA-binding Zn-ribbon protein involved in translation (DUF1610 family)